MKAKSNKRRRPQLTVGGIIDFLSKFPKSKKVWAAPSIVCDKHNVRLSDKNVDAPSSQQEFIIAHEKMKVVVVEVATEVIIGFIAQD